MKIIKVISFSALFSKWIINFIVFQCNSFLKFASLFLFAYVLSMGICGIVNGVSSIVASLRLRQELTNEGSLMVIGIISIVFGCWMVFFPGNGLLERKWPIAGYLCFSGLANLYGSLRLWKLRNVMNTLIGLLKDEVNMTDY